MVLSGMDLTNDPADTGSVLSHDNKEIFSDKSHILAIAHDLNMGEILAVRADFILTLNYQDAAVPQNPMRFPCTIPIESDHGLMEFNVSPVSASVVPVVFLKRFVRRVRGSSG